MTIFNRMSSYRGIALVGAALFGIATIFLYLRSLHEAEIKSRALQSDIYQAMSYFDYNAKQCPEIRKMWRSTIDINVGGCSHGHGDPIIADFDRRACDQVQAGALKVPDADLDGQLMFLSHWSAFRNQANMWRDLVEHHIVPLQWPKDRAVTFLELGSGVGAMTRWLLKDFPCSAGVGVDLSLAAIRIARSVLPRERYLPLYGDMTDLAMLPDAAFDYVIYGGSLTYIRTREDVFSSISEAVRVTKPGGRIVISMLPSNKHGLSFGVGELFFDRAIWVDMAKQFKFHIFKMEDTDAWKFPHFGARYAVWIQK